MSSEVTFNIQKQPENFCNYINLIVNPLQEIYNLISDVESNYYDNDKYDQELLLKIKKPDLKFQFEKLNDLISEMDLWSSEWINLLSLATEKEHYEFLKLDLTMEIVFFRNQSDIFKLRSNFFCSEFERLKSNVFEAYEEIESEIQAVLNGDDKLDIYFYNYESALVEFIGLYEMLRSAASAFRDCVNNDIKVKTKIQLYRCNYSPEFVAFLEDHRINTTPYNISAKDYKHKKYLVSRNRNYS